MKKTIFLIFLATVLCSTLVASDIPFFKSLFMGDEEYVRHEIMKCKDVTSVEVIPRNMNKDDYFYWINVYLTDNRYISFGGVRLGFFRSNEALYGKPVHILWQINDIFPVTQAYEALDFEENIGHYYAQLRGGLKIHKINSVFQNIDFNNNSIPEIINNFDTVYSLIMDLTELPLEIPDNQHFDVIYEGKAIFPEEFENEVPFSIIEQRENINTGFVDKTVKTFEERYKFYKMPVARAATKKWKNLKPEYVKHE